VTEEKYEKLAEIKIMYKKETDPEKLAERDAEINLVKSDMESLKAQKVLAAKEKMKTLKKAVNEEKS